mgnify:CR=1 FL=1
MSCLVFVYGTLRRGFSNHHFMRGARFLGGAATRERYAMYVEDCPYLVQEEALYQVAGEVHEVSEAMLLTLDALEEHPTVYERRRIPVALDSGREIEAWCYFARAPRGRLLPRGDFAAGG